MSGTTKIEQFVARHSAVAFDSNLLIGLIEQRADYSAQAEAFFQAATSHRRTSLWTSVLTIAEVLERPLHQRDEATIAAYEQLLYDGTVSFADIDQATVQRSTHLMGIYQLKVRDALHVASLLDAGVGAFITADQDFASVSDIDVFLLTTTKQQRHR